MISEAQLCELATSLSLQDELALIALIGWPFLLRIPSECLPLRRRQAGEDLDSETRQNRRAVIGLSGAKLAIKLSRRKHMADGSRLARVRICEECMRQFLELYLPQPLRPVSQLWPAIRRRAAAGGPLFPGR